MTDPNHIKELLQRHRSETMRQISAVLKKREEVLLIALNDLMNGPVQILAGPVSNGADINVKYSSHLESMEDYIDIVSSRTRNTLKKGHVLLLGELVSMSVTDLKSIPNLGDGGIKELAQFLQYQYEYLDKDLPSYRYNQRLRSNIGVTIKSTRGEDDGRFLLPRHLSQVPQYGLAQELKEKLHSCEVTHIGQLASMSLAELAERGFTPSEIDRLQKYVNYFGLRLGVKLID